MVFLLYQQVTRGITTGHGLDEGGVSGGQLVIELFGLGEGVVSSFVGRVHTIRW